MKKVKFIGILWLLLAATELQVFAGNTSKTGSAGALEVLLPVGARGAAMAGSTSALLDGVESIHWNPAGLAGGWGESSVEAMFSHMDYIATTTVDYAAVAVNVGDFGVLGFSLRSFGFGDIQETTENAPDGTGRTFSPTYVTVGGTYAKSLTDRIHIGFTGKYISETILRTSAAGFAFDAGVVYSVGGSGPMNGLRFGVTLKNIGPKMQFSGGDLERSVYLQGAPTEAVSQQLSYTAQSFELPASFEMAVGYDYTFAPDNQFSVNAQFNNMNFGSDQYKIGGEYSFKEILFLRGGYTGTNVATDEYAFGATYGAGLNLSVGSFAISVDYAYLAAHVFDGANMISVRLKM